MSCSSCTTRPGQTNSEFGVKVTGRRRVGQAIHEAHATGLPKPCTVSYAPADPRYHRLIKVGDDDIPFMLPHNSPQLCPSGVRGYIVSFVLLCGSLIGVIALMDAVEPISFCVVFGIVAVISAPFVPCGMMVPCCDSIYTVTKLKAPYQRPTVLASTATAAATRVRMTVACPPGTQPGQTVSFATPGGATMTAVVRALESKTSSASLTCSTPSGTQVPPGVAPGATFQVAMPSAVELT